MTRGQAMTEFMFMSFVALIILFVAVQMAAIGREYMALGQLSYQVARWATNPGNNVLKDASGNPVNSPQCTDVVKLIKNQDATPYADTLRQPHVATGYGQGSSAGVSCKLTYCRNRCSYSLHGSRRRITSCAAQRGPGVGVQITLSMNTGSILF
jgi:hypothetical protein